MENRICGIHAVFEALASARQPIERIHISRDAHSGKLREIVEFARQKEIPIRREDKSVIDRLAQGTVHQGIVAITAESSYGSFEDLFISEKPLLLILDGVEDPHNLGAVLRTSEACAVSGVVVPERHSAPLSATVSKASAGATAYVRVVRVTNLVSSIEKMKERGLWIVGLDASAKQSWTEFDYTVPTGLVLGGEHRGLRRLVREHCDVLVRLPMLGKIQSLNISVAAAVVLYEAVRQRTLQT
jgi:23S rRNA (guanosine2251-2'-O)-methyltransferase